MLFGSILARLDSEDGASAALEALGDLVLLARIRDLGEQFDETPGAYVANAARRFAAAAPDEEWTTLIGTLERAEDPARATLRRILAWSMARDAEELAGPGPDASHGHGCGGGSCGCGGKG